MVGWHHQLNGHEFKHTLGDGGGQRSLMLQSMGSQRVRHGPAAEQGFQSLLILMSIESVMPFNHLIFCRPLLFPPSTFPSIRVFSNTSVICIRWPKYWNLSISPSSEYSVLVSFRIDRLDLLAVQGTLKSLFQQHSSKASISVLSFLYSPTLTSIHDYWKNHSPDKVDLC